MRTIPHWHWIDEWLDGFVQPAGRERLPARIRHERFILRGVVAALIALVTLPLALAAEAPASVLSVWGGLVLVSLLCVVVASRRSRIGAAQALMAVALTAFVVLVCRSAEVSPEMLCLALLVVPLEASSSGSRRGFAAAFLCALMGAVIGASDALPSLVGALAAPWACALLVGSILVTAHGLSRAIAEDRLDTMMSTLAPPRRQREDETLLALDDLVTWHDRNGAILRSNGASASLLGVPSSAIQGSGLFTRILVGDRPAFLKAVSDAARGATTATAQFRVKTGEPSGGVVWVEMRVHGVRLSDDLACAAVAVTRDISALRSYAEERDILRREAVNANDLRAQLLATVSHELRTPLNAIIGYSEILMGKGNLVLLERRESYAQIIHQSGEHMLGVVNTLLDLSAIEAGQYALDFEPVAMAELVRECCLVVALRAEEAGIALTVDLPEDLPKIVADRRACRQMLLNLLSNAIKFTPRGGEVRVEARRDRMWLSLSVHDTGIGVAEEDLARLGVPFYRGAGRSRADEKGSGLGLSVVRGLVALHRGQFSIANATGNGTIVRISLPVAAATADDVTDDMAMAPLALPHSSHMMMLKTG